MVLDGRIANCFLPAVGSKYPTAWRGEHSEGDSQSYMARIT